MQVPGLDVVKCLVKEGASFDFPSTEEVEEDVSLLCRDEKGDYRTNYSVYLLEGIWKASEPSALLSDGHGNGTADDKGGWQSADISS